MYVDDRTMSKYLAIKRKQINKTKNNHKFEIMKLTAIITKATVKIK